MRNPHRSKKKDYLYTGRITQSMRNKRKKFKNLVPLIITGKRIIVDCCEFGNVRGVIFDKAKHCILMNTYFTGKRKDYCVEIRSNSKFIHVENIVYESKDYRRENYRNYLKNNRKN